MLFRKRKRSFERCLLATFTVLSVRQVCEVHRSAVSGCFAGLEAVFIGTWSCFHTMLQAGSNYIFLGRLLSMAPLAHAPSPLSLFPLPPYVPQTLGFVVVAKRSFFGLCFSPVRCPGRFSRLCLEQPDAVCEGDLVLAAHEGFCWAAAFPDRCLPCSKRVYWFLTTKSAENVVPSVGKINWIRGWAKQTLRSESAGSSAQK